MAASVKAGLACGIVLQLLTISASAHPMPNTVIDVTTSDRGARLLIALPVSDLRLALPAGVPKDADLDSPAARGPLATYFDSHLSVLSSRGEKQAHAIESMTLAESSDPNVGRYQELTVTVWIPATSQFDPTRFTLQYDAIIHQVPNHFAVVRTGEDAAHPTELGVIAFDFSRNITSVVELRLMNDEPRAVARAEVLWTTFLAVMGGIGYFMVRRRSITTLARRMPSGCAALLHGVRPGAVAPNSQQ